MKTKRFEIDIIVLEDNNYYRYALLKELKNCILVYPGSNYIKFNFHQYAGAIDFINDFKDDRFLGRNVIAFIDYYLGDGINGKHIIKRLKENNCSIKTVLISQSNNLKYLYRKSGDRGNEIDFVAKDEYTLPICSLILEQFIEAKDLQSNVKYDIKV